MCIRDRVRRALRHLYDSERPPIRPGTARQAPYVKKGPHELRALPSLSLIPPMSRWSAEQRHRGVTQLGQRTLLELTDPLAGQIEHVTDLIECAGRIAIEPVSEDENARLPFREVMP